MGVKLHLLPQGKIDVEALRRHGAEENIWLYCTQEALCFRKYYRGV